MKRAITARLAGWRWFFQPFSNAATFMIILPLFGLGMLYWFNRPQPRRTVLLLVIGIPTLTLLISGIKPALHVSHRVDDGDHGVRHVQGSGIALLWAPEGPGWPEVGGDWFDASLVTSLSNLRENCI